MDGRLQWYPLSPNVTQIQPTRNSSLSGNALHWKRNGQFGDNFVREKDLFKTKTKPNTIRSLVIVLLDMI